MHQSASKPVQLTLPNLLTYKYSSSDPSKTLQIHNPSTGTLLTTLRVGDASTVSRAVKASHRAFSTWRWQPPAVRSAALLQCASALEEHADELATLLTLENGKPFHDARNFDVTFLINVFRYFGSLIDKLPTESFDRGALVANVIREPKGVCVGILPFNWPPIHAGGKAAPALAAGNSFILKPGEQAPLTVMRIVEILETVLPEGLLQAVPGDGVEVPQALMAHEHVKMVSLTGSTGAGRAASAAAAPMLKHVALELGGKNAFVVFEDADLEMAARDALEGALFNKGEACTATARILVHKSVHDEFVARLAAGLENIRVGDGMDSATHVGPLVSAAQKDRVLSYAKSARDEGATVAAQAPLPREPKLMDGYYVQPTLFNNTTRHMRINREEAFGPLLCTMTFSTEDEAVDIVNESPYGLTCVVFTGDQPRGWRVCRRVEAGATFLNNYRRNFLGLPFGGVKDTGSAREHSIDTLDEWSTRKIIQMPSGIGELPEWGAVSEVFGPKKRKAVDMINGV